MIAIQLIGGDALVGHVQGFWPKLQAATKQSITASLFELSRHVKESKLSGQVLNTRTGRLRRSIHASEITVDPDKIFGTVGTNVEYARPWEFGFHGTVTVKEHMRMLVQAWGRPVKEPHKVLVRSHSRQVNIPERSFLRSSLRELGPKFTAKLKIDLARAMQ